MSKSLGSLTHRGTQGSLVEMNEFEKLLEEASSAAKKDDFDRALTICNSILQTHPEFTDALRKRSDVYTRMGDLDRAITDLTEVIKTAGEPSKRPIFSQLSCE